MKLKYILVAIIIPLVVLGVILSKSKNQATFCSRVGEQNVCVKFKCQTGDPVQTFGGAGACSDGSKSEIVETWEE